VAVALIKAATTRSLCSVTVGETTLSLWKSTAAETPLGAIARFHGISDSVPVNSGAVSFLVSPAIAPVVSLNDVTVNR